MLGRVWVRLAALRARGAQGARGASGARGADGPGGPGGARGEGGTGGAKLGERPEPALLQLLVCPLSRKPLRYEAATNELVNEELGIAYPVADGIPNMLPQAARRTRPAQP